MALQLLHDLAASSWEARKILIERKLIAVLGDLFLGTLVVVWSWLLLAPSCCLLTHRWKESAS